MLRTVVVYRAVCKCPVTHYVAKAVVDRIGNEERDGDVGKLGVGQQQKGSKDIDNGSSGVPFLAPLSEAVLKWSPYASNQTTAPVV